MARSGGWMIGGGTWTTDAGSSDNTTCTSNGNGRYMSDTAVMYCHNVYSDPEPEPIDIEHVYYLEIPKKILSVKNMIPKTSFNIKQPISRSGFKRGQRRW